MRVRPGCRVGEVHLLDWSQLNFYCFPTYCTTPLSISISALFKLGSNSWSLNGYFHWNIVEKHFHGAFHSFVLTSSLLNPSFSFLALRTLRGASETKLVLRGIARMVLGTWSGASEASLARNICSNLEKPRSAILASSASQSNPDLEMRKLYPRWFLSAFITETAAVLVEDCKQARLGENLPE